jgi:hypothetical protein
METRRRFLGAVSLGLTGLAGCLSENDGPGGDSGTDTPTTDDATTDGPRSTDDTTTDETEVSVTNPVVRKAVTHYSWPASTKILAPEDQQFVVATVAGPEETTPPEFTLEAGGDEFSAGLDATGRYDAHLAGREGGSVLQNEHAEGYLAFRVPSPLATDEARIVRDDDGPATPLPAEEVAVLGRRAPDFELDALELPDSVESPEQVDVSLAVTNVGDVDGRFLAGVNWPTDGIADDDETTVLERRVAAGETTSFSLSLETTHAATETSEHPLTVEGCVSASRSVEVIVDETTTPDQRYH